MDIKAVALIGIKISKDEMEDEWNFHFSHDKDRGKEWSIKIKPYLTELQDCYVFSEFKSFVSEDSVSILYLHNKLNYSANSDLITAFKTYFPALAMENHPLDMYLGLQTL